MKHSPLDVTISALYAATSALYAAIPVLGAAIPAIVTISTIPVLV